MPTREEQHEELRQIVSTCTQCRLHTCRKQTVFSRGSIDAPIMVVGEAPGKDEDEQGFPFVGKAGDHLSELLKAASIPEELIYYSNILKCRPENNKFPEDGSEPETCRGYLLKQIELVKPKAIILAGKQALRYLLIHGTSEKWQPLIPWINKQFRRRDPFGDIRFLVVYHPAYLIRRNDEEDEEAWVQAVAGIWNYVQHKINGTAPAPIPFKEIHSLSERPKQGRNLFTNKRDIAL